MKIKETISLDLVIVCFFASAFEDNIERIKNLISLYRSHDTYKRGRKAVHVADILRAAVILLHSALEEFLRGLAIYRIGKYGNPDVLDRIQFVKIKDSQTSNKITLGEMAKYRGKSVDDFIQDIVRTYYRDCVTFNNCKDIINTLNSCGLGVEPIKKYLPILDEMIRRRHQIVHRSDKDSRFQRIVLMEDRNNRGYQIAKTLSITKVKKWLRSTELFVYQILDMATNGEYKIMKKRKSTELLKGA